MSNVDMKYTDMTVNSDGRDYSTFDIRTLRANPMGLWSLGGGALRDLAAAFGHQIVDTPTPENLSELIRVVGASKELQLNIGDGKRALGDEAYTIATELLHRSGIMRPLNRSFLNPTLVPRSGCTLVITGGVANWMLRRAALASRVGSLEHRTLIIAAGSRPMKVTEHTRVEHLADHLDHLPTEGEFAERYLAPVLEDHDGFTTELLKADSANGNDVLREMFDLWPTLLTSEVMVIGNAPSAIQSAGQFRAVAREIDPTFDANGTQLYVWSDTFPVARDGDSPADGQNPISGLGSLARAALFLCKAALD